jgi:hypothetical protein
MRAELCYWISVTLDEAGIAELLPHSLSLFWFPRRSILRRSVNAYGWNVFPRKHCQRWVDGV